MECYNVDSNGICFGHPFTIVVGKSDKLIDIIPRLPSQAQHGNYFSCPCKSVAENLRLRRPLQPRKKTAAFYHQFGLKIKLLSLSEFLLWSSNSNGLSGDGKTGILPICLIIEHAVPINGTHIN